MKTQEAPQEGSGDAKAGGKLLEGSLASFVGFNGLLSTGDLLWHTAHIGPRPAPLKLDGGILHF